MSLVKLLQQGFDGFVDGGFGGHGLLAERTLRLGPADVLVQTVLAEGVSTGGGDWICQQVFADGALKVARDVHGCNHCGCVGW